MSFKPVFMSKLDGFYAESRRLRTPDDWSAFERKWFDRSNWPLRQGGGGTGRRSPRDIGGRLWSPTAWSFDLTAEARYHYFAVLLGVGTAIRFPDLKPPDKGRSEHWSQHCPYCEISTFDLGDGNCPVCGRALLYEYVED